MIWQDALLMVGGFGFSLALLPSLLSTNKPAWSTSLLTGSILLTFSVCYLSLDLLLAFISTVITAILWLTLFVQKIKRVGA